MKKSSFVLGILSLAVFTSLLVSCEKTKDTPGDPVPILLTEKQKEVVDQSNNFAFNLFKEITGSNTISENIMISPFSISSALSMTLNGASGETYNEMLQALSLNGKTLDEINDAYLKLMSEMVPVDERVVMNIANSVWVEQNFIVKEGFLQALETYYEAETKSFDAHNQGSVDLINSWIAEKTNDKIKKMISQLDPGTRLLLINAIYFNGKWKEKFDPDNTSERPFYLSSGITKNVSTMTKKTVVSSFHKNNATIVDLPYGQGNYTMVIALPDEGVTPAAVVSSLDAASWQELEKSLENAGEECQIYLPKFKYEYKRTMVEDMQNLGMKLAFTDFADFSNMSNTGLKVYDILHKTYIATDEEGTEAAAATVVSVGVTSAGPSPEILINRPFVYFIREIYTGTIVFMGIVEDPSAS
ncbi:MAG TPA: serpin family protein [Bacteroidales bacterium]|nr:serpin family protein [Bacteroidales bacterium]